MAQGETPRPIIKKKKIIQGGGHHGGAWKVAYADFVTAMMAFFMLMWLLGATTENQRKGLADFFTPSIPINRVSGGGQDAFGGDSVFSEETLAQSGTGAALFLADDGDKSSGNSGTDDDGQDESKSDQLEEVEKALLAVSGDSVISELLRRHIVTALTDQGLIIEIFDRQGATLFEPASDIETELFQELVAKVALAMRLASNPVAVEAHVSAEPLTLRSPQSWPLSTARAQSARLLLLDQGFPAERVARVTGHGSQMPEKSNPMAIENNRVRFVLLRL